MDKPINKGGRPRTYREHTIGVRMTEDERSFCSKMDPKGNAASYLRTLMERDRRYLETYGKEN